MKKFTVLAKKMVAPGAVFRVEIKDEWGPRDFYNMFKSIEVLYGFHQAYLYGLELVEEQKNTTISYVNEKHTPLYHFANSRSILQKFFHPEGEYAEDMGEELDLMLYHFHGFVTLQVIAVKYSSPGFTDFGGVATAIHHLLNAIKYYFPNKHDKEKRKIKEQKRIALQIKNLEKMGLSTIQIQKIILLETLHNSRIESLIRSEKITSIKLMTSGRSKK